MSTGIDLPTIGSKWTHVSEPGVYVITDALTDGRVIWTELGGDKEWVAPVREFIQVFTPLVESPITGPNYPGPQTGGNTLTIDGKALGQLPAQPASEYQSSNLTAAASKLEGALYAAMERGSIGYSSTQRRPAVEFLTPIVAELIQEARQHVAEEIATKLDDLARMHSKSAEEHRALAIEAGTLTTKGQSHVKTAIAFKNKADGAYEATHAAREIGGIA